MKPFISKSFYGVINYVAALTSMASPWLFGFSHLHGATLLIPILIGWVQLIMAIFSNNSHGFIKVFPMQMHHCLDVLSGFFLMMLPWIYGFYPTIFWPHLLIGGTFFIAGIFTVGSPLLRPPHKAAPEAGMTSVDAHEGRLNV